MSNDNMPALPPLPKPQPRPGPDRLCGYSAAQMRDYARAAQAAMEAASEPAAWRWRFLAGADKTWRYSARLPRGDLGVIEQEPLFAHPQA